MMVHQMLIQIAYTVHRRSRMHGATRDMHLPSADLYPFPLQNDVLNVLITQKLAFGEPTDRSCYRLELRPEMDMDRLLFINFIYSFETRSMAQIREA